MARAGMNVQLAVQPNEWKHLHIPVLEHKHIKSFQSSVRTAKAVTYPL